jgi:hypothetical protein
MEYDDELIEEAVLALPSVLITAMLGKGSTSRP